MCYHLNYLSLGFHDWKRGRKSLRLQYQQLVNHKTTKLSDSPSVLPSLYKLVFGVPSWYNIIFLVSNNSPTLSFLNLSFCRSIPIAQIPSSFICTSSELMLENENSEGKESHLLLHISRDGISCCFYAEWIISKSCDPSSFLTHGTYILSSVWSLNYQLVVKLMAYF